MGETGHFSKSLGIEWEFSSGLNQALNQTSIQKIGPGQFKASFFFILILLRLPQIFSVNGTGVKLWDCICYHHFGYPGSWEISYLLNIICSGALVSLSLLYKWVQVKIHTFSQKQLRLYFHYFMPINRLRQVCHFRVYPWWISTIEKCPVNLTQ